MAKLTETYCKVHKISLKNGTFVVIDNLQLYTPPPDKEPGSIAEEAEWAPRDGLDGYGRSRAPYCPALNDR